MRLSLLAVIAALAAALLYGGGLAAGAVSLVGFERNSERMEGWSSSRWFKIRFGTPVWLRSGGAIRADFEVDARFGAVTFTVAPPLVLRTSLQAATAYVEGKSRGSVLFVAQAPGWYTFYADPTPLGGPRCRGPDTTMIDILIGSSQCPSYDVTYSVAWRLAAAEHRSAVTARLFVPRRNEKLVTTRIRDQREIGPY